MISVVRRLDRGASLVCCGNITTFVSATPPEIAQGLQAGGFQIIGTRQRQLSMKRPRDDDDVPKLKMEPLADDVEGPPPGSVASLLTLPRSMRLLAHQIHLLDRRCRAALYDATRLTELYLLVAACPENKDGTADYSSIPPAVVSSLPPTTSEALTRIEANIREAEELVVRFAVQKRQMAELLVKTVDQQAVVVGVSCKGGGSDGKMT